MRRHIFVGAMILVGSLLGGVSPAAAVITTASASHFCVLSAVDMGGTTPVPGLFSETINDPVFANANPNTPIEVKSQHSGDWPRRTPRATSRARLRPSASRRA